MKLLIEIDTANPPTVAYLRSHADYLSHIADNHAEFFNNAPGNAASIFGGQKVSTAAAPVTPPAPPAPPVPTNNGDGSATDLLRPAIPAPPAAAPVTPPAPAGELDKTGLPWDARIHAGTKSKNGDGTWKKRKGVDPEEVARVTAELMGAPVVPPPPAGTPSASAPVPPVPPAPPSPPAAASGTPPAPPAPPAAPVAPPPAPAGADMAAMRKAIIDAVGAKKLDMATVNTVCMNYGCGNLGVAFDSGALPMVYADLGLSA